MTEPQPGSAVAIALRFLDRLNQFDLEGLMELLTEDAVQEIPFDRNEATRVLEGKPSLRDRYDHLFEMSDSCSFETTAVHPHADPEWVTVEYHGQIVANDGEVFENTYLGMFRVREGQVHRFREFFASAIPEGRL